MPAYNDFAFRPNLTDPEGVTPSAPPVYTSPDIWPNGPTPLPNYQTVLTQNWNSDAGQQIQQGVNNIVYVRCKNFGGANNNGKVYLYWAPSAVINWPSQWANNKLLTDQQDPNHPGSGLNYLEVSASNTGNIAVGKGAFLWTPGPPPSGSDHYCLFSQVVTAKTPNPIPGADQPMTAEDMATIVANDLGIGWRNTVMIHPTDQPDWQYSSLLTYPSDAPQPVSVQVVLQCTNMTGGSMGFTCSSSDLTSNPIALAKTPITNPNQVSGVATTLSPGFSGSITVSYWHGSQPNPSGAGIALKVLAQATTEKMRALVSRKYMDRLRNTMSNLEIQEVVSLGQMNYVMK
ncbi:MAG TPA: hypothetical protein VKZ53_05170 [Candidatus Angelobacter sp.]|nr:hypothetical protein [Candidatus Angelobacter sp.]